MIQLPVTTYIGKRIPKEGFYLNLNLSSSAKKAFVEEIDHIVWLNLLSASTLNVGKGEKVNQIDVLQVTLKRQDYNRSVLEVIEKAIPRHLIFLLKYGDEYQLHVHFKEEYQKSKFRIVNSYTTNWLTEQNITLTIKGLDLDQVYDGLVYQIAGSTIEKTEGSNLKQSVQQALEIEKLTKKLSEMYKKLRAEKQFNIQLKISNEIRLIEKEIQKFKDKPQ